MLGVVVQEGTTEKSLPEGPFVWSWPVGFDPGGLQEVVVAVSIPTSIFYPSAGCIAYFGEGIDLKVQTAILKGLQFIRCRIHGHEDVHKVLVAFTEGWLDNFLWT